jgi:signal peptidase I
VRIEQGMRLPVRVFGIVCLSIAAGLLLYWCSYMVFLGNMLNLKGARISNPNSILISSGIIGSACSALISLGYSEFTGSRELKPSSGLQPRTTLILRRDRYGKATSVSYDAGETISEIPSKEKSFTQKFTLPKIVNQLVDHVRRFSKVRGASWASFTIVLILGTQVSLTVLGYSFQDVASGASPFIVIASESMSPYLNPGDVVILRRTPDENIQINDIIAFKTPSPYDQIYPSPIVHKVIEKWTEDSATYFRTGGDANPSPDSWALPAENVIGACITKIPYIGLPFLFINTTLGFLALVSILAGYLLYTLYEHGEGP